MPVYEYECTKCSHVTEVIRPMSAVDDAQPCEKCGGKTARKHSLFSAAAGQSSSAANMPSGGGGCGPGCGCHPH